MKSPLSKPLDVLLINADSSGKAYQGLSTTYSAIEPPTWSLLLAQSLRAVGLEPAILDCCAEHLTWDASAQRIVDAKPRLACFVVYGQNPNSGTTEMIGNTAVCAKLKQLAPDMPTCFVGSHTSALPREVLALPYVDFVLLNEGVYALRNLLKTNLKDEAKNVRGIGHKLEGGLQINPPEQIVPQERMDLDLPGYAWDLLPYKEKPLDLYRSHFWHAEYNHNLRSPFAAIYTSLGCKFRCSFCMVNIVNRTDNSEGVAAANSPVMRYWSSEFMLREIEKLANLGVQTVRLSDEMFFLDKRHFEPLLKGVIERQIPLRTWSYARVDTVRPNYLELFKKAGVGWLGLGVEAGNQLIRQEVSKGTFQEVNIREIINTIRQSGIYVGSNFIFGFPDDNLETMQQTLDLALELNTEFANMYPCQALPGSSLHVTAKANGWKLPDTYEGYAFLSYECQPMPTKHLSAAEVLRFRDEAWQKYFTNPAYLALLEKTFGAQQRKNVEELTRIPLRRKLLETPAA